MSGLPDPRPSADDDRVDVLVLGGGPAGCATALCLARQGHRVAVVERTRYEAPRVGETLSPGAGRLLDHLGVREAFESAGHLPAYGLAGCWGSARREERDFLFGPHGLGWHLDRRRFDAGLAEAAERVGATVWRGSRIDHLRRDGTGWRAMLRTPGGDRPLQARFMVDATGRAQAMARHFDARRMLVDRLVALHATLPAPAGETDSFTLVESAADGWFYSTRLPAPAGEALWWVALMTDADVMRRDALRDASAWGTALRHAPETAQRLAGSTPPTRIRVVTAHSARLDRLHGPGWVAVGDAAACHDPLSSSGITRALDGGIRTAAALHAALEDRPAEAAAALDALARRHEDDYAHYLATRARYYAMEQRWPDSTFWRRRQHAVLLDPACRLVATDHAGAAENWPADLAPLDPRSLVEACREPRVAAEVVAAHRRREELGDLRIILGLQWLLQGNALAVQAG